MATIGTTNAASNMAEENTTISINPKKLAVILGIIVTLASASYATYGVVSDFLGTLATKVEVKQAEINSSIELVNVTKMGYEDELVIFDFLIETDQATAADRVSKSNVERRIKSLDDKLNRLEERSTKLQGINVGSDTVRSQVHT